jgi:hypothetical protein
MGKMRARKKGEEEIYGLWRRIGGAGEHWRKESKREMERGKESKEKRGASENGEQGRKENKEESIEWDT